MKNPKMIKEMMVSRFMANIERKLTKIHYSIVSYLNFQSVINREFNFTRKTIIDLSEAYSLYSGMKMGTHQSPIAPGSEFYFLSLSSSAILGRVVSSRR